MPYRWIYLGLGLAAIGAIALGVALSTEGEPAELPDQIVSVYPQPGDLVPLQTEVRVVMDLGYRTDVYVDGWLMTDVDFVEGTGTYTWAPGPGNPTVAEWTPGEHTISIVWDTADGLSDPGEYEWSFRVG